ncbi:MAG: glycosyltransferase family 4 protein [Bacteroidota bacterium]
MSKPGRYLLLLGPYPPPFGGVSVHLLRLLKVLDESQVPHVLVARTLKDPVSSRIIPSGTRIRFLRNITRHLEHAFCVHDHSEHYQWKSFPASFFFFWTIRRSGRPWLLTIHDGTFPQRMQKANPISRFLIRSQLRRYSEVVVINKELGETVRSLGVEPSRVSLIKSFIPFHYEPPPLDDELRMFLDSHRPIIAVSGAFHATYHFDVVAEAFLKVRTMHASAGLIFISGSFTRSVNLEAQVRHLSDPVKESVFFAHDLPPAALLTVIRRSNMFIRSAFPDGDGMSMREAMVLGIPVVASETGHRPEGVRTYSPKNPDHLAAAILKTLEGREDLDAIAQRTARESREQADSLLTIYKRYMSVPAP